ncbi:23S rRNA (guanosine(2251)-2'-O)-methyltransferase RlmB [Rickettsiales endosymbiont of Stachyamoeba lipophora]|uniref:23S rRNA (guanosine(2251)-2'-O)-methyltransferase RlmB n=1 Tax=Rickettsiales endosymbiont of Stachyamoeba lipophora TaxID=2486578 RepID=UPI000F65039D|nr:23S rRNA (guanosine(2251)-2'-O)-methyltransferase RlmB [Rickettsiales endosymbiont of Stachyamoeba lipophora]AZL15936.1 23S rRNA (guanosine(2251)-2'-O)-methyltransferase RlmB [Rickettsiales endosymbiont of Stachyamoeba lipophora]
MSNTIKLFGKHACLAAINNPNRKKYQLYTSHKDFIQTAKLAFPVVYKSPQELSKIAGLDAIHGGFVLECSELSTLELDEFLYINQDQPHLTLAALDQITDPHNVGAIIRSAAAFNVQGLIITERHSPKNMATIAKTSAGCIEFINLIEVKNLAQSIEKLKKHGFWSIGLDGMAIKTLNELPKFEKKIIILGSEGKGMRQLTTQKCDELVKIPMNTEVESLNVSNAAAICFYHFSLTTN